MQFPVRLGWRQLLVLAACCLPLAACGIHRDDKLTISHSEWPGYEYLNLAVSKGFVPNATVVSLTDQSEVVRAYLRGELDVVQLTTVDILDICSRRPEHCPVIVLVLNESLGGDQIMALNLNLLSDLAGKSIGVSANSFGPFVLHKALESVGLSIDDVSIVPMLVSEMPEKLSTGEVDAVVVYPPNSEQARAFGAKTIFDSSEIPGEILDVLAVSPSVYASRKNDIKAVIAGWFKAHRFSFDNSSAAVAAMASNQDLTPQEFREVLSGLVFHVTEREQEELLQSRGPVVENLEAVKQLMTSLNLFRQQMPSPRVSRELLP